MNIGDVVMSADNYKSKKRYITYHSTIYAI